MIDQNELRKLAKYAWTSEASDALRQAADEIERLRAALEWYAEPENLRWDDTACVLAQETLAMGEKG